MLHATRPVPAGSLAGVSGYQLCFSKNEIYTPGDEVDTLVAMNPAALKTNVADLKRGGTLIVNEDAFDKSNIQKAHYEANPLDDGNALAGYRLHKVPMTRLTRDAVEGLLADPEIEPAVASGEDPHRGPALIAVMLLGRQLDRAVEHLARGRVGRLAAPLGQQERRAVAQDAEDHHDDQQRCQANHEEGSAPALLGARSKR